jgi:hypothetical protein
LKPKFGDEADGAKDGKTRASNTEVSRRFATLLRPESIMHYEHVKRSAHIKKDRMPTRIKARIKRIPSNSGGYEMTNVVHGEAEEVMEQRNMIV